MPKPPALQLHSPDVAAFVEGAPTPSSAPEASPTLPERGHVLQASGRVVRRLVTNIDPAVGVELERRRAATGASLSRIVNDLLRAALGV